VFFVVYVKDYPFKAHKHHSLDYVRQFPHLRPRTLFFGALLRIRNAATMAVHKYFQVSGINIDMVIMLLDYLHYKI